jgi:hypothetical protein
MLRVKTTRLSVAVLAVATIIAVVGSVAIASNMGFKLNKPIVLAGAGQIGSNWTSIPYNNPYGNAGAFCNQTGLVTALVGRATLTVLNEATGAFTTVGCGTAQATALALTPGKGLQIRQPTATGAPTSIIIVGSHNPALSLTVPKAGTGAVGNFWFSVPYHTTAVSANDLCQSSGLFTTAIIKASLTKLNATTGAFTTVNCQSAQAVALQLVLGDHVQLRNPNGPNTFIAAHF